MSEPSLPRRRRRKPKWRQCIPPAAMLRERLAETEIEAQQLRELLATAERIEAAEAAAESTAPADDRQDVSQ